MLVTLVHPPVPLTDPKRLPMVQPPLGLAYVAAGLREAGHTVRVVDGLGEGLGRHSPFRNRHQLHGLRFDEVLDRVDPASDVVGVGVMFSNHWPLAKVLLRALRARFPRAVLVCGGEHVTALTRFVMEDVPVDYAVVGEGEETVVELLAHLESRPDALPLDRIAGLAYRTADGSIAVAPRRKRRRALDDIPWPAWDLFPLDRYLDSALFFSMPFGAAQRPMPILATRGCPYTCKFCSNEQMWGTQFYMRSPTDVVDEMERYVRRYGATDFHFQDLTLVIDARWVHRLCDAIIARNLAVTWKTASGTRSEALDLPLLEKMRRSGCDEIILAPESGSAAILRINRKRVKLDKVLSVARTVRDHRIDMQVTALTIVGFPEERLRDVLRTFRYLARMARSGFTTAYVSPFAAYPGSEYHDVALREGRIVHDDAYFLGLKRSPSFLHRGESWHPRWSGRVVFLLCVAGYAVFFGTYYLSKPAEAARGVWSVLARRPRSRFERFFAYRLWGPSATRRPRALASDAVV